MQFRPLLLLTLLSCLFSCGKKAGEAGSKPRRGIQPISPDEMEVLLSKQELVCDQGRCPSYLTKIAVVNKENSLDFCTGVLTDATTVAMSTSCLPKFLRVDKLDCKKDVHFFFENAGEKPLRATCKSVLRVAQIETKDPTLWRSDVTFLELEKKVDRKPLGPSNISRIGMADMAKVVVWSIDSANDFVGHIKKNECEAVHNTYFNPFSSHESSPNVTIAGCPFVTGNSGSPVLDYRGRLRGLVSRPISTELVTSLQARGILDRALKPISFAANFACAPTIYDEEVLDFNECTKKIEENESIRLRSLMISLEELFRAPLLQLETNLNKANRYVKVKLLQLPETADSRRVKIAPKCFKDVARWIGEFTGRDAFNFYVVEVPEKILKRSMDDYGRLKALETDLAKHTYTFQFYPRILKNTGKATVFVLKPGAGWEPFPNISENCSLF